MVNEDVSFRFNISDGSTVVGHSFVRRVSVRSTVKTLNNFLFSVFCFLTPAFCFGLVDRLGSFMTSVYPLLVILMDRLTEAISIADFGSHMWSHPRFRSFAGFGFFDASSCSRDEDVIEARNSKR